MKLLLSRLFLCVVALGLAAFFSARTQHAGAPKHAFYFWKTQWASSPEIEAGLAQNDISKLYMRFFDVQWDAASYGPRPVSPLQFNAPVPHGLEIIPVIYLTNSVFMNVPYENVEELSNEVWLKVQRMAQEQGIAVHQLQLDCDWTDTSRQRYFHFAELLRQKLNKERVIVSSTIRLHQIKYAERTGIPPVNRGMLMFYNFGHIEADSARSSIFNVDDAKKYSSYIARYSMPLDVSLPLFSWIVHSRDSKVQGLLEKVDVRDLVGNDGFKQINASRFQAVRSFFFRGRYFMDGDLLAVEATGPETTLQAASLAARGASRGSSYDTIAFFDLDERNLSHYASTDFKKILQAFE